MVIWQGAIDVAAGRMTGGTIAAFVLYGGLLAGAFGTSVRSLWRPAARRRARRSGSPSCSTPKPDIRAPANPAQLPEPRARRARASKTSPSTIRPGRETSALDDFSLASSRASGSPWSGRRAPARRPSSSSPSASTTRRRAACCSTASTCATPIPPTFASASRWCRRKR